MAHRLIALLVVLLVDANTAPAAGRPLLGTRLHLVRSANGQSFLLILDDQTLALPPPGSVDDPAQTAGLELWLFGHGTPADAAAWNVPAGSGWTVWSGMRTAYRYRNAAAPAGPTSLRTIKLRQGRVVKIIGKAVGLALADAQGSIGVRLRMGGTELCALFDATSVVRDVAGRFLASRAAAPADCNDPAIGAACAGSFGSCAGACPAGSECAGFDTCTCIPSNQPCGDTAPACNGECPAGGECGNTGGVPYPGCGCIPAASTGCGDTYPTCGGACPSGTTCMVDTFTCCGGVSISGCACLSGPPPPPCGGPCPPGTFCVPSAPPGVSPGCYPYDCSTSPCPAGSVCTPLLGGFYCAPVACTGGSGYPTCDGACDPGFACQTFASVGTCDCAPSSPSASFVD